MKKKSENISEKNKKGRKGWDRTQPARPTMGAENILRERGVGEGGRGGGSGGRDRPTKINKTQQ